MIAVPALASVTILTCLLGPIIGYLLGFASGFKYKKLNSPTSYAPAETETEHSTVIPVYEDIKIGENMDIIELSHNISYAQVP